MKLSIVIVCWNDQKLIKNCLQSIYNNTYTTEFEVIVSDNGSTDGSVQFIRENFPKARVIENHTNLGFARASNAGILSSVGQYVVILHPDTVVHAGALDKWIEFADNRPNVGGFGCRILNHDGSYQDSPRPFPSVRRYWIASLCLRQLGRLSNAFLSDTYVGWKGDSERQIDYQPDCCLMVRGDVLKRLNGFDEQFFYGYAGTDLCRRIWDTGYPIMYSPEVFITHVGGQTVMRSVARFKCEKYRSRYRYFYKHFGTKGAFQCRRVTLASIRIRQFGYTLLNAVKPREDVKKRLELFRIVAEWNSKVDPVCAATETGGLRFGPG